MSEEVKRSTSQADAWIGGMAGEDKESRTPRGQDARIKALADETEELEHIGSHL